MNKFIYTNYPKEYGYIIGIISDFFLPFKIFLLKLGFEIYLGGKEQDKWVIKDIFKYKKKGYFIDLAAADGIRISNTFLLEKKYNWSGICIEPNYLFFQNLKNNRKCHCIREVVMGKKKKIKFFEDGGIGGIIGDQYDNNYQKRSSIIKKRSNRHKIKNYKSVALKSILKKFKAPKVIDYLSLDVEGAETIILKKFPFKEYKFLTLTIERPTIHLNKILFKNGYKFVKNHKVDTYYIHESLQKKIKIKLEKFEQIGKKIW